MACVICYTEYFQVRFLNLFLEQCEVAERQDRRLPRFVLESPLAIDWKLHFRICLVVQGFRRSDHGLRLNSSSIKANSIMYVQFCWQKWLTSTSSSVLPSACSGPVLVWILPAPQVCKWKNVDEIAKFYGNSETSFIRSFPRYVPSRNTFRPDAFDYKATVNTHYYGARRPSEVSLVD